MKAKLLASLGCLLLMAGFVRAQTSQSIDLYTTGSTSQTSMTVTAGSTFSLDSYVTFSGFTAVSSSYWLEASSILAPHLTLTSESYFQNWDPQAGTSNTVFATSDSGADSGFLREVRDLGSTSNFDQQANAFTDPLSPGLYKLWTLNFTLDSGIAPGIYTIAFTDLNPVPSTIGDDNAVRHDVPQAFFTITVVPEPATLSLLGLSGLGSLGMTMLRRRRRS